MSKATQSSGPGLSAAFRRLASLRVVLALGGKRRRRTRGRRPAMLQKDRVGVFEEQAARIEAQLAVLEKDTDPSRGEPTTAGRRLRLRNLELTRQLLAVHLGSARKISRRTPTLTSLQEYVVAAEVPTIGRSGRRAEVPEIRVDKNDLADTPVNLQRMADLLFLYDEVRRRLLGSSRPARKGDDHEEGVA